MKQVQKYSPSHSAPVEAEYLIPMMVSVLMPVYNESELVGECINRVLNAPLPEGVSLELVVVDDASTDGSPEIVEELAKQYPHHIRLFRKRRNQGKGSAIQAALDRARGEFSLIQDSDLEYSPEDYPALLTPLIEQRADVVFGSRFATSGERRALYFWHSIGNRCITAVCNMVSDLNLTDIETGYKAFRTSLIRSIPLTSKRFGIEPEMTIKLAQRGARVYETPISYNGRTYDEGKKIGLKDAFQAMWVIGRCLVTRKLYREPGAEILDTLANAPRFNRWMADTIRPYVGKRVVEIGAGIGNLSMELSRRRERYLATDIDDEHIARLGTRLGSRRNLAVDRFNLVEENSFESLAQQFDTVICLNVLEHVNDDALGLKNIHELLEPGGHAIVLVPQGMDIYGTLDEVLGHYRRYSEKELKSKMEAAGFRVEKILRFNRVTRPGWFLNGRVFKQRTFSRLQLFVFDRLVPLWRKLDRLLPWPSVSIIAIGTKLRDSSSSQ